MNMRNVNISPSDNGWLLEFKDDLQIRFVYESKPGVATHEWNQIEDWVMHGKVPEGAQHISNK